MMKSLGISIDPQNVSLLELDAYHIIEGESHKASSASLEKESKKNRKKHGNK